MAVNKDKSFSRTVGQKLKTLRVFAGLSAADVAKAAGLRTEQTVYSWERGRGGLTVDTVAYLCTLYGSSIDAFFSTPPEDPYYTSDEIELIRLYRELNDSGKGLLMDIARVFSGEKDVVSSERSVVIGGDNSGIVINGDGNSTVTNY